jgi:hypothetical protein
MVQAWKQRTTRAARRRRNVSFWAGDPSRGPLAPTSGVEATPPIFSARLLEELLVRRRASVQQVQPRRHWGDGVGGSSCVRGPASGHRRRRGRPHVQSAVVAVGVGVGAASLLVVVVVVVSSRRARPRPPAGRPGSVVATSAPLSSPSQAAVR